MGGSKKWEKFLKNTLFEPKIWLFKIKNCKKKIKKALKNMPWKLKKKRAQQKKRQARKKGGLKQLRRGPLDPSFHFIWLDRTGGLKTKAMTGLFENWKCFIPRMEAANAAPKGSNWIIFPFYWYRKRSWGFQKYKRWHQKYMRLQAFLKTWQCFIPRRESASQTPLGSNCF